MEEEIRILRPRLVIPVGRLAIVQFIDCEGLENVIGRKFHVVRSKREFDLIPLPHPSGASPWPKIEPGKTLLAKAMRKIAGHPAMSDLASRSRLTSIVRSP
jgi:uracil-DNA glycosylase